MKRLLICLIFLCGSAHSQIIAVDASLVNSCQVNCSGPETDTVTWTPCTDDSYSGQAVIATRLRWTLNAVPQARIDLADDADTYTFNQLDSSDDIVVLSSCVFANGNEGLPDITSFTVP